MTNRFGKCIFVILLLTCINCTAFAQMVRPFRQQPPITRQNRFNGQSAPKPTKIQQLKEDYISKRLALPPDQTIRFETLYLQYMQEKRAVQILRRINNSDAQANGADQVNKALEYERELLEIKQRYTVEFSKIMPPEKVSVIFKSEQEFDTEAVRNIGERRPKGSAAPQPPGN